MYVRFAIPSDVREIIPLWLEATQDDAFAWPDSSELTEDDAFDTLIEMLSADSTTDVLVAFDEEGDMTGFAFVDYENARVLYLKMLFVSKEHRGKGYATALLNEIVETTWDGSSQAEQLYLDVVASNQTARIFYAKGGFIEIGRHPEAVLRSDGTRVDNVQLLLYIPQEETYDTLYKVDYSSAAKELAKAVEVLGKRFQLLTDGPSKESK